MTNNFSSCSDVVITESEDVTERLKTRLKKHEVYTVTNNVNQVFLAKEKWKPSSLLTDFQGITILSIGANYPHKQFEIIPKVVREILRIDKELSFRFVLTLQPEELEIPEDLRAYITFLGSVSIEQCPPLYEATDMVFLPSLLECFTASYPEAMQMKRLIVTTDLSFAKGLCGDAALFFEATNPQDAADKIVTLAKNEELRQDLVKKGEQQIKKYDTSEERAIKYVSILENTYQTNQK